MRLDVDNFKVCVDHCHIETSFVGDFRLGTVDRLTADSLWNNDLNFTYWETRLLKSSAVLAQKNLFLVRVLVFARKESIGDYSKVLFAIWNVLLLLVLWS